MIELSDRRRRLVGRLRVRKTREREGLVLVEGVRAVRDVMAAGARPRFAVVSSRLADLDPELPAELAGWCDVAEVTDLQVRELSATEASQGVLAVVEQPSDDWFDALSGDARVLVLDGIQDPGNAGTLIRSAAAFALDGVVLLDGCVDPWNVKAVRASAGAAFRCGVAARSWATASDRIDQVGLKILVADAAGSAPGGAGVEGGWALVVGSEGRGARAAVLQRADARLAVSMPGGTESLNAAVAGSILVYELTRPGGPLRA